MNFNAILNLISKRKSTSAEYRSTRDELDIKGAEAVADALEAKRRSLLLSNDENALKAVEEEIRTANRHVERLHAAAQELDRLALEAEAEEQESALTARVAEASNIQQSIIADYVALDKGAVTLSGLLYKIRASERELQKFNIEVDDLRRPHLTLQQPLRMLVEHTGSEALPQIHAWHLSGYTPPFPGGCILQRMKELQRK